MLLIIPISITCKLAVCRHQLHPARVIRKPRISFLAILTEFYFLKMNHFFNELTKINFDKPLLLRLGSKVGFIEWNRILAKWKVAPIRLVDAHSHALKTKIIQSRIF